jgi:hypothetical protein
LQSAHGRVHLLSVRSTREQEIDVARIPGSGRPVRLTLRCGPVVGAVMTALCACGSSVGGPDSGDDYDARPGFLEGPLFDATAPTGSLELRLANMLVAGPNLTICISTIPGSGVRETTARMVGTVDPSRGLDGTLPYPGVSPYLSFPIYPAEGYAIRVRLYDREDLPFAGVGAACPDSAAPVVDGTVVAATASPRTTLVAMGVVEGAPATCTGGCPPPRAVLFSDDPMPAAVGARVRVLQTVPNLPAPIHICFDPDYVDASNPGEMPSTRVLPPRSDVNGIAFAEATPFIDVPALSGTPGAFFVHVTVPGPPDCVTGTRALGPITLPFPVPASAPVDVARTLDDGDVITLFAFGRTGGSCSDDSACAPLGGTCDTGRRLCQDPLSPSVLPWQDVMGR